MPCRHRPPTADRRRRARRAARRRRVHRCSTCATGWAARPGRGVRRAATSPERRTSTSTPPSPRTRPARPAPAARRRRLRGGDARSRRERRPPRGGVRRLGRPGRRPVLVAAALGRPSRRARARRRLVGLGGGRWRRLDDEQSPRRAATSPPGRGSCPSSRPTRCSTSPSAACWSTRATRSGSAATIEPVDPVAGHIPGAVNVPDRREPHRRRPVPAARRAGARSTPRPRARRSAAYCGSGVTATHDILAMAVAGIEAALYPGSWSEWVADPERPVATGE